MTLETVSGEAADAATIVPLRAAGPQATATILLVGIELLLADSIKYTLERDGYRIVTAPALEPALAALPGERPGLLLVALDHPAPEVLDFCRRVRSVSSAPIILIAAAISDAERAEALVAGADDLLKKPFSVRELAERVAAQLPRHRSSGTGRDPEDEVLRVGPVEMDVANHEVRVRGMLTVFPPKEFALLETLLRSRGRLLTRDRLIGAVWGPEYYGDGKTLDTHVKRLRRKIEADPQRPRHLIVVRGLGYRFLDAALPG